MGAPYSNESMNARIERVAAMAEEVADKFLENQKQAKDDNTKKSNYQREFILRVAADNIRGAKFKPKDAT